MPTLTIQLPHLPPVEHILREETVTIGRMKGNTIALDDSSVSLSHAKITRKNAEFFLKDLNSTNGTMLNGQSVNEAKLRDGDQVKFGEVVGYYRAEPAPVSPASGISSPGDTPASQPTAQTVSQVVPPPVQAPAPAVSIGTSSSTAFVSKRLVSQAAQTSQPAASAPPGANPDAAAFRGSQSSRQEKSNWLFPALGALAAIVVAVVLWQIFFGGNQSVPTPADNSNPPAVAQTKKTPPGNPAAAPAKPDSQPAIPSKVAGSEPAENQSLADLRKALKASDPVARRRAAAALHSLGAGAKDAVPDLRTALDDSDPEVRMWSALALVNNKSYDKAAIPILVQVLHHENSMLRQVACLSLALIPYDDAEKETVVSALADAANKDADEEVRKNAISALKIIAPDAVPSGK